MSNDMKPSIISWHEDNDLGFLRLPLGGNGSAPSMPLPRNVMRAARSLTQRLTPSPQRNATGLKAGLWTKAVP